MQGDDFPVHSRPL